MTPVGDPKWTAEQAEKACSLLCKLALVGNKFITTPRRGNNYYVGWLLYGC